MKNLTGGSKINNFMYDYICNKVFYNSPISNKDLTNLNYVLSNYKISHLSVIFDSNTF